MRLKKRYSFSLDDETRLENIFKVRRPAWQFLLWSFAGLAGLVLAAGLLIFVTPLKRLMPGYMEEAERNSTISYLMRLDSLHEAYEANQAYLDNIISIFDTDRVPSDSMPLVVNPNPLTVDSLSAPTSRERRFVGMMQEREKYNISVLAPMAAEGIGFSEPSDGAWQTAESMDDYEARIIVRKGASVNAVADGRVVEVQYSPVQSGYAVVVQHPKGFISRLSHLDAVNVRRGERVGSGQPLGSVAGGDALSSYVSLEIWRDTDPLLPSRLIPTTPEPSPGQPHRNK